MVVSMYMCDRKVVCFIEVFLSCNMKRKRLFLQYRIYHFFHFFQLQSFWMENQTRNDKNKDFIPLADNTVPLYDCGYALGLTSADGSSNVDG